MIIKNLIIYFFGLLLFIPVSCQKKQEKNIKMQEEQFSWSEGLSCPLGYPIQVYKGSIGFKSLSDRLSTGKYGWGHKGNGMNDRSDWMPRFLNVTWLSYAEDCMYIIETPIAHKKLYELFKKGFDAKEVSGSGKIRHETYDAICTGLAPGGVVVVWAVGPGRQTEIGRYQGKKIVIPQSEISQLDSHEHLLFDAKYKKGIMTSEDVIPKAVQEANKNKPIPFGLWDTYRIKYNWKPVFELQNGSVLNDRTKLRISFLNGEVTEIFNEYFPVKNHISNPIPRYMSFSWKAEGGKYYAGNCDLNEESSFKAFKEVFGEHPENITADLDIRVNMANSFFTVKLKGNGKDIFIETENLEVFEATKYK
jgi:hypothetical protein